MNRLLSSLIGAGLVVMLTGAAKADIFTIQSSVVGGSTITQSDAGGDVSVTFSGPSDPLTPADSTPPGTSVVLLNYSLTSTGAPANVVFDNDFMLTVLLTDTSYAGDPTHESYFKGRITGTASAYQNNLVFELDPLNADATDFIIRDTHFVISDMKKTAAGVPNSASPGAVSARIVGSPIPEPGSMALLGTGILPALALLRRRR